MGKRNVIINLTERQKKTEQLLRILNAKKKAEMKLKKLKEQSQKPDDFISPKDEVLE